MPTTKISNTLTPRKQIYSQISCLLLNHIEIHNKNIFIDNPYIRKLLNKKTQNNLKRLKEDYQAKQLALQYFQSFQLISDILTLKIEASYLADIQKLCYYLTE